MAFGFSKKKPPEDGDEDGRKDDPAFEPQPDKAREWVKFARASADSSNHAYALLQYAHGIRLDPESLPVHEAMYESAIHYFNNGGKPATGKDIRKLEEGSHPVHKFAAAEFAWMKDINNGSLALKLLEAIVKAEQTEFGHWFAPRSLAVLQKQKKLSKRSFIQARELYRQIGDWDSALRAAEMALHLDPSDAALEGEIKDIAAQRAMDQGRYAEETGDSAGFLKSVRDIDKQRELEEAEAISGGASVEERNLARWRMEYEKNPDVPDVINRYAQLVKTQGTPQALQESHDIYMRGFQNIGEYRFRAQAGDIQIELAELEAEAAKEASDGKPDDAALRDECERARSELLELQQSEYGERVKKYPTDRPLRFRLGMVEFLRGQYGDAMASFQIAKEEPKVRVRAGHMLGRCFAAEAWHTEAILEFKDALQHVEGTDKDAELSIRYDLMVSLMEEARIKRSSELASEAFEICSSIARKDITYRDIRDRRHEIGALISELSGGGGDGSAAGGSAGGPGGAGGPEAG